MFRIASEGERNLEKGDKQKDYMKEWYRRKDRNYLLAVKYRIIMIFTLLSTPFLLIVYLDINIDLVNAGINQILGSAIFVFIYSVFPLYYAIKEIRHMGREHKLLSSIYRVRKNIRTLEHQKEKDFRPLQINLNRTRESLKGFVEVSRVISPPIPDYELNRLQRAIDIFFNTTCEILFPIRDVFSREQKIDREQALDYYNETREIKEQVEQHFEEEALERFGTINFFDFDALDEFFEYLGNILFSETKLYRFSSFKYQINLIELSHFFIRWNKIISTCRNCISIYRKAEKDIEKYYSELQTRETQRKEKYNEIAIVVISVIVSTVINTLFKLINT